MDRFIGYPPPGCLEAISRAVGPAQRGSAPPAFGWAKRADQEEQLRGAARAVRCYGTTVVKAQASWPSRPGFGAATAQARTNTCVGVNGACAVPEPQDQETAALQAVKRVVTRTSVFMLSPPEDVLLLCRRG